jgi:hypothetical protein
MDSEKFDSISVRHQRSIPRQNLNPADLSSALLI